MYTKGFALSLVLGVGAVLVSTSAPSFAGPYDFSFTQSFPGASGRIPFDGPSPGEDSEGVQVFAIAANPIPFIQTLEVVIRGLDHTSVADLDLYLINPTGHFVELMTDRGGMNAVSNVDLTFRAGGAAIPAILVTGTYAPEGDLTDFTGKTNVVGTWLLLAVDDAGGDIGRIDEVTLRGTVPEPMTASLLALGGLAALRRRKSMI